MRRISSEGFINYTHELFKNGLSFLSSSAHLSPSTKKAISVAAACFGVIALLYVIKSCWKWGVKKINGDEKRRGKEEYNILINRRKLNSQKNRIDLPTPFEKKIKDLCDENMNITIAEILQTFQPGDISPYALALLIKNLREKLENIPKQFCHENFYIHLVELSPEHLKEVPEKARSLQVCLTAMRKNPHVFPHVPYKHQNEEICLLYIEAFPYNLENLSIDKRTYNVCFKAVSQMGHLMKHVPQDLIDLKLCQAIKHEDLVYAFDFIPEQYQTEDICVQLIRRSPQELKNLKESQQTLKVCQALIESEQIPVLNLKDVPEQHRTKEICKKFVSIFSLEIKNVPDDLRDFEICLMAAKKEQEENLQNNAHYNLVIDYVPQQLREKIKQALEKENSEKTN